MKRKRLNLSAISTTLSRIEMKQIMAGSGEWPGVKCCKDGSCGDCLSYSLGCNYYNCGDGLTCEEVNSC